MIANYFRVFSFAISVKKKWKSHWISFFLLLINVLNVINVIKYVTETLISLLWIEICDIWVSIYSDKILGNRESQTWHVFNFVGIKFHDFEVLKTLRVQNLAIMVKNCDSREINTCET